VSSNCWLFAVVVSSSGLELNWHGNVDTVDQFNGNQDLQETYTSKCLTLLGEETDVEKYMFVVVVVAR